MRNTRLVGSAFCLVVVGFALGWFSGGFEAKKAMQVSAVEAIRYLDPDFSFISPLVGLRSDAESVYPELGKTKSDIERLITKEIQSGGVRSVSMYFRLPNAHWFGINPDVEYEPASLLKVPIMIAYLKQAESDPNILKQKFLYEPAASEKLPNGLAPQLKAGYYYTTEQLLEAMVVDSDNVAKDLLLDHMDTDYLNDVFQEMDVGYLQSATGKISPRAYVRFLSRLYNATFLSRASSNRALELLSKATFKDGLMAGLPAGITVAHKYGERGIYEEGALTGGELHDCGVVYAKETSYYLCIMTSGTDIPTLANIIKEISAKVYEDRTSFSPAQ